MAIQVVSTGLPFIIVPLKTLDALRRARIHTENYFKIIKKIEAKAILIFWPETYNIKNEVAADDMKSNDATYFMKSLKK